MSRVQVQSAIIRHTTPASVTHWGVSTLENSLTFWLETNRLQLGGGSQGVYEI